MLVLSRSVLLMFLHLSIQHADVIVLLSVVDMWWTGSSKSWERTSKGPVSLFQYSWNKYQFWGGGGEVEVGYVAWKLILCSTLGGRHDSLANEFSSYHLHASLPPLHLAPRRWWGVVVGAGKWIMLYHVGRSLSHLRGCQLYLDNIAKLSFSQLQVGSWDSLSLNWSSHPLVKVYL